MASETSIIGSDSGAIPEVVNRAGLIFPEGGGQALAAAIEQMRTSTETRQRCGERGKQLVAQCYGLTVVQEKLASIYRDSVQ